MASSLPITSSNETRESGFMSYENIKKEVKVCMFDQYGTVVDMQGGAGRDCDALPQGEGLDRRPAFLRHLVAAYALREFDDRCAAPREHTPYREIGHRAVAQVLERAGIQSRGRR